MGKQFLIIGSALVAIVIGWHSCLYAQDAPSAPAGQQAQQQLPEPEVLEQGPIHEAFAEPLALQGQERETIAKQPPEPVQELPPEQKPEGQNVQWIPGYWLWDQGRDDFVWVSGMWRDIPPGRTWVPGEWQQTDRGFLWVPGFWADAKQQQIQLLPEPPASLDTGPSSPAPGDNYLWAPGNWYWQDGQYVWQPGYWYEANPNWVWVPNHYSYTPRGYCYVSGYWDYLPYNRGLLFAPVYWGAGYRGGYGYGYYRPRSVINTALLIANLAVYRPWGHYYYGNWGGGYPGWLQPWGYNYGAWGYRSGGYFGYDPLWSYFRWSNRNRWDDDWWRNRNNWYGRDRDWDDWNRWSWDGRDWDRRRGDWDGRPGDRDGRPGDRDGRPGDRDDDRRGRSIVTDLENLTRDGRGSVRTRELSQSDLERIRNRSQEIRSRRESIIADTGVAGAVEDAVGRDRRGRGPGSGRNGVEGRVGVDGRGQIDRGRTRGQFGVDGDARVGDNVRAGTNLGGQFDGNRQGRGRGQLDADAGARVRNDLDARARAGTDSQFRGGHRGRGPAVDLNAQGQGNVQGNLNARNLDSQRNRVESSVNELLRGRANQQGPSFQGRTYSRGGQGSQFGDRSRGQIPDNMQRNLQGPVQQRVMRFPSGQQVMPQGQNFRSRGEGQRFPQGSFNRGGGGRPSINIQQGGGADRSIQRSLPSVGGGSRGGEVFRGGGGRGGQAFQGGGGGRGGGSPFGGGGGDRGGGRGRGGRD